MRNTFAAYALLALTAASANAETTMANGDAQFAAALHGALRAQAGNLFYSPASVRIAMAMAAAGARGETATELHKGLALPDGEATHAAIGKQLASWAALADSPEHERVILRVANRLWAQAGHEFRDAFLKILRDDYRAPLGTVDFRHDAARVAINKWVAEATEQKIKELLTSPIPGDTKLVITNAVYFKAHWAEEFNEAGTRKQPFFAAGGKKIEVPLMRRVDHLPLARVDGLMMAELAYGDGRLAMDVILPNSRDGIARVEEQYAKGAFDQWVHALGSARVDIMMPRFRISSSFELASQLSAMGMARAFKYPGADFSGIDGTHELFIGAVVHQAFVDVDEHGTEAAAATAVMMRAGAAMQSAKPIEFRADHPFLFVIRDTQSGAVLFAGRLADPSAK